MPNSPTAITQISGIDLISAATVASLVLSILAIVISFALFYLSWRQAEKSTDAASRIAGSVEKVEALFDNMYSDTFGMVKEAISDLRQHAWQQNGSMTNDAHQETEQRIAMRIDDLRQGTEAQLQAILGKVDAADERYLTLRHEVEHLLSSTIDKTAKVESEVVLEEFLERIRALGLFTRNPAIFRLRSLQAALGVASFDIKHILSELEKLHLASVMGDGLVLS